MRHLTLMDFNVHCGMSAAQRLARTHPRLWERPARERSASNRRQRRRCARPPSGNTAPPPTWRRCCSEIIAGKAALQSQSRPESSTTRSQLASSGVKLAGPHGSQKEDGTKEHDGDQDTSNRVFEYLRPRRFVAWFYASRARAMFSVRLPEGRGSPQGYFGVA
jgi:hypothetical protein